MPSVPPSAPVGRMTPPGVKGVPDDLIDHLRCPITRSSLRWMSDPELVDLNAAAGRGDAAHLDSSLVDGQITAAFINAEGSLAYRVEDGILLMLPLSAIGTTREAITRHGVTHRPEKAAVQSFYDQIGWKRDEKGDFEDAVIWEDLRPVSADYLRKCHLRLNHYLKPTGNYLLDVASGPVQYAEYLSYSKGYNHRICMDISIQALREARRKVGDKGVYILGDITNLPLHTDSLDAVISLHTIYHVPLDEQAKAFEELYRVLKTGRSGVIVYTFSDAPLKQWATKPAKWWNLARNSALGKFVKQRILGRKPTLPTPRAPKKDDTNGVPFYFHAHPLEWFRSKAWTFPIDIVVWRSVNVWFLRTYIQPKRCGRFLLSIIYGIESIFPRLTGRYGPYPMFILRK
ncbi:MAG TPA: class I SAM-dependent methyltransferase [Humisphaera sp.]|nr:class I SAM-dependent methyltransferase [Humisphaera sp.]